MFKDPIKNLLTIIAVPAVCLIVHYGPMNLLTTLLGLNA